MNDALKAAAKVDPEWAKKEQRREWLVKVTVAGTLIALAVGAIAFAVGVHNSTEITQVEHSACQVEPDGHACQTTRRESAKAESIATACIAFKQVGYACPKPGSKAARQPEEVMPSSPSSGHSLSGRHEGGSGATDQPSHPHAPSVPHQSGGGEAGGGHEPSGPPAAPTSPPSSSSPPTSTTTERVTEVVHEAGPPPPSNPPAETAAAPIREAVGGVVEALKPTVEETGATVNGTVESVTGTTCSLAKVLCP